MKTKLLGICLVAFASAWGGLPASGNETGSEKANPARDPDLPVPTPAQLVWQDCEIGLLFCFDLAIAAKPDGDYPNNNGGRELHDPAKYNPVNLETDAWLALATASNAKYALFTATHFNGFMQWQSDAYPYGLKQSRWRGGKGDVVGDFVKSCRKADVLPGVFFSTHRNMYQEVWGHYTKWGKGKGTPEQEVARLRLRVTKSLAPPKIRSFACFQIDR